MSSYCMNKLSYSGTHICTHHEYCVIIKKVRGNRSQNMMRGRKTELKLLSYMKKIIMIKIRADLTKI